MVGVLHSIPVAKTKPESTSSLEGEGDAIR
jgi:hypothetical protein